MCKNRVVQKSGDQVVVRSHGKITFAEGRATALCFTCKTPVELPLVLSKSFEDETPSLVVEYGRTRS